MSNMPFYSCMARITQAYKICWVVSVFPTRKLRPSNNMMNIQSVFKFCLMLITPLTDMFISRSYRCRQHFPSFSFTEFSSFYRPIIRMIDSFVISPVTLSRTKFSSFETRFKTLKIRSTISTFYNFKSLLAYISTFYRTAIYFFVRIKKFFATNYATYFSGISFFKVFMTERRTESFFTSAFMFRFIKSQTTVSTYSLNWFSLRYKLTWSTAINSSRSIGFKRVFTGRAGFSHG